MYDSPDVIRTLFGAGAQLYPTGGDARHIFFEIPWAHPMDTPFRLAAEYNATQAVSVLAEFCPPSDMAPLIEDFWPSLGYLAAESGSVSTMEAFLKAGFDISLRDRDGDTVLVHAFDSRGEGMMEYLLSAGGAGIINSQNRDGDTVLHHAVRRKMAQLGTDYVQMLLGNGADVDIKNNWGETPANMLLEYTGE